jgi:putative transposase
LKISHKNQVWATDITSYGKRVYVFNCDYWFAYKICFELERKQHNECRLVPIFCKKLYKSMVPEIFNTDQGSQYTSEVHTNVLLNNGIKISMDGKDDYILLKIMEDSQIRECIFTSIYWRNQPLQRT